VEIYFVHPEEMLLSGCGQLAARVMRITIATSAAAAAAAGVVLRLAKDRLTRSCFEQ